MTYFSENLHLGIMVFLGVITRNLVVLLGTKGSFGFNTHLSEEYWSLKVLPRYKF